jgi:breast cancer 2 susceptibility protein
VEAHATTLELLTPIDDNPFDADEKIHEPERNVDGLKEEDDDERSALDLNIPGPSNAVTFGQFNGFASASGFTSASRRILVPSAEAIRRAEEKRRQWEKQDVDDHCEDTSGDETLAHEVEQVTIDEASVSERVRDVLPPLATPPQTSFSPAPNQDFTPPLRYQAEQVSVGSPPTSATALTSLRAASPGVLPTTPTYPVSRLSSTTPFTSPFGKSKARPFKSPLLPTTAVKIRNSTSSSNSPGRIVGTRGMHPLAGSPLRPVPYIATDGSVPSAPLPSASATLLNPPSQPVMMIRAPPPLGFTPRRKAQRPFSTPFKPGMAPGEPGRKKFEEERERERHNAKASTPAPDPSIPSPSTARIRKSKGPEVKCGNFFDLRRPPGRRTLAESGLRPQTFSAMELQRKGM